MKLFHVSEEPDIKFFEPRLPSRSDLDQTVGLVWAIDEKRLPNFLTPRDCPRVTFHIGNQTTDEDKRKFFTSSNYSHVVIVERAWIDRMKNTTLYLYEFAPDDFVLQDSVAGYYVSTKVQYPKAKHIVTDLFAELIKRNVEIRITDNLWDIAEAVKASTLNWSLCRMANAKKALDKPSRK
ncbi:MAG: hypothetical protein IJB49_01370 [Clostridia bacterium]|nr:hypothetical protein [Clostridia bacterium]